VFTLTAPLNFAPVLHTIFLFLKKSRIDFLQSSIFL